MTIEHITGPDTGIYREERWSAPADDIEGLKEITAQLAEAYNFSRQIGRIESYAKAVLRDAGFDSWPVRGGVFVAPDETRYQNFGLPPDASPAVRDADSVLFWCRAARAELARGQTGETLACLALRIGSLAERLGIRPAESHAARGRKTLAAARAGHAATHGDASAKLARHTSAMKTWASVQACHPNWTMGAVDAETARRCKCTS